MPSAPQTWRLLLLGPLPAALAPPPGPALQCLPLDGPAQLPADGGAQDILLTDGAWLAQLDPPELQALGQQAGALGAWGCLVAPDTPASQRLAWLRAGVTHLLDCRAAQEQLAALCSARRVRAEGPSLRVLLLDDGAGSLRPAAESLAAAGLGTRCVSGLQALLDACRDFSPDLILASCTLEECHPRELLTLLQPDGLAPQRPLLFLATRPDPAIRQAVAAAGGEVLELPPDGAALAALLAGRAACWQRLRRGMARQQAREAELLQRFEQLRGAMDAHAIVSITDRAGTIVEVNDRFCEISGYRREELLGANHRMLRSGVHPPAFFADLWQTISAGRVWRGEICNRRKQGGLYWVEATIVPVPDPYGQPERYVSIRTDVTALKEHEEALRRSEERLRVSQNFANIGTWDWDVDSGELYWSERIAPLFGHAPGTLETSYANFIAAVHPDDREALQQAVQRSLDHDAPYEIEHRVVWPDGQVRWLLERGAAVRDAHGRPLRMLGVVQDIHARKTAELALSESERRLREAQQLAHLGHWQADLESGALDWSEEIYTIFGHDPASFRPSVEAFQAAVHPDDRDKVAASEQRAAESGHHDVVHRILRPDGSIRHVHERARTERNEDGQVVRMVGTVQDVTEQVEAENRLRESEERFSFAVEGAGDGIWDWDVDSGSLQCSALCSTMLGYAPGELPPDVEAWRSQVHADDAPRVETALADYLEGRSPHYAEELRLRCRDGHYKWVLCRATVVARHRDGRARRIIGIHTDISRQKRTEDNLQLFRRVFNASQQCIAVADADGKVVFVNEAYSRTMGYSFDEMRGRDFRPYAAKDDTGSLIMHSVVHERRPWTGMTTRQRKDGSEFVAMNNYGFVSDEQGALQFIFVIFSDYTEELAKRAELAAAKESAERANQAKSDFLSSMSHELRTPMNAIMGFAQLLECEEGMSPEQLDSVHEILKAGRHLLELINEVLDLARIESGRLMLSIEPVHLSDVLADCRQLIQPLAAARDIRLELQLEADPWLRADRVRLKQVLVNLLSNAIKYNRAGGGVRVRALEGPRQVRVEISDDGPGIPAQRRHELFQPFSRLGAENGSAEGTGIGLSITRRLVEAMGGEIGLSSEEGQGATFWFELPAGTDGHGTLLPAGERPAAQAGKGRRATVLCVDDNPTNLKLVTQLLAHREHLHLVTAPSPELGIELAMATRPQLVLLDINMPRMDGYQVLRVLRTDPRLAGVPVVAVTASAMPREVQRGLAAGFAAYLTKPLDVDQFLRTIDDCLATHAAPENLP